MIPNIPISGMLKDMGYSQEEIVDIHNQSLKKYHERMKSIAKDLSKKIFVCSVCNIVVSLRPITVSMIHDFPVDYQQYIDRDCPNADKHLAILRRRKTLELSLERRQEILDCLRHSGKNVGEVAGYFGLDSDIVADIIIMNIEDYHILREVSL